MGNENSTTSNSRDQQGRIPPIEPQNITRKLGRPSTKARRVDFGVYPQQHGKKSPLDNDDTFTKYIQRAKYKIRSLSNIGHRKEESNHPPPDHVATVSITTNNGKGDHKDHFSDFIHNAKKKLRTTSRVGKGGSFKRG